ncbi:MAG: type VI-B CRISPR-associated RNA-guided ribonuclease Cas13b [Chitinophagales bacterium]|nr:type VI-B CRISPR-associated RNA-guided ribonuclease Cas13b [Chitinophagales bacterium]
MSITPQASGPAVPRYTFNKEEHPFYFGHYINHGRHNAFLILNDIARRFNLETVDKEEQLSNMQVFRLLRDRDKPDESGRLLKALTFHFPFLQLLSDVNGQKRELIPDDVAFTLESALVLLRDLRNAYSHYLIERHAERNWTLKSGKPFPLPALYAAAVDALKPRYGYYTDDHIKALKRNAAHPDDTPNDAGSEPYNERALVFFTCFFLQRKEISLFLARLNGFATNADLGRRALLDAYRGVACRLPQDKLESSDILLDMFNELDRCPGELYQALDETARQSFDRTPKPDSESIWSDDQQPTLMIRHSDRFPWFALRYFDDQEIFPSLRFHIHLGKLVTARYEKNMNGVARERVLLHPLRTFARWGKVDLTDLKRRLSEVEDPAAQSRLLEKSSLPESWLQKSMGKLKMRPEVEQFTTTYLMESNSIGIRFLEDGEQEGYPELNLIQPNAEKERFKLSNDNPEPDAVLSTYELAALFLHQRLFGAAASEAFIKAYIDLFRQFCKDLKTPDKIKPIESNPQLRRFRTHLRAKRGQKPGVDKDAEMRAARTAAADEWVRKHYNRTIAQLPEGCNTVQLQLRYLPDSFREYLLGYAAPDYKFLALEKLKAKLQETKERLKDIGTKLEVRNFWKRPAYKERELKYAPKSGHMAVFLARDLIFFKPYAPEDHKANNDQFVILEYLLAYFGSNREGVKQYLLELGLLPKVGANNKNIHPFLADVNIETCSGIFDFYEAYLIARWNYLRKAVVEIEPDFGNKPDPRKPKKTGIGADDIKIRYGAFLKIQEKAAIQRSYANQAVLLPRGLFNAAIEAMLRQQGYAADLHEDKTINIIEAIRLYIGNDDTQPMYKADRYFLPFGETGTRGKPISQAEFLKNYEKNEALLKKQITKAKDINVKEATEQNLKDKQREKKFILDREQVLRYTQALDRVLWLMCKDRAARMKDWKVGFEALSLAQIDAVLTSEIPFHKKIGNVVLNDTLSIRRYGEVRRLQKDRRLTPLLEHFQTPDVQLDHADLKAALEDFERRRVLFFETIYKFEKAVFDKCEADIRAALAQKQADADQKNAEAPPEKRKNKVVRLDHQDFVNVAFSKSGKTAIGGCGVENLIKIRNKILHNEVPSPAILPLKATSDCAELVKNIFETASGYYHMLLREIGAERIVLSNQEVKN